MWDMVSSWELEMFLSSFINLTIKSFCVFIRNFDIFLSARVRANKTQGCDIHDSWKKIFNCKKEVCTPQVLMTPDWASWSWWHQDIIFLSFSSSWESEHPSCHHIWEPERLHLYPLLVFVSSIKEFSCFNQSCALKFWVIIFLLLIRFLCVKSWMDDTGSSLPFPGAGEARAVRTSASSVARRSPSPASWFISSFVHTLCLSSSCCLSVFSSCLWYLLPMLPWRQVSCCAWTVLCAMHVIVTANGQTHGELCL